MRRDTDGVEVSVVADCGRAKDGLLRSPGAALALVSCGVVE